MDVSVFVFQGGREWFCVLHRLALLRPTTKRLVGNISQCIKGDGVSLCSVVLVFANGSYPVNTNYVTTILNELDC